MIVQSVKLSRIASSVTAAVLLAVAGDVGLEAGSPIYVGKKTTTQVSIDAIDHALWDSLLEDYVDANGMVDYRNWRASAADVLRLDRYLAQLSAANPSLAASRESWLAFWINAYNAVTIKGILREYPTTSIRNHTARLFGYNIWHDLQLHVGDRAYALEQIEHTILRKLSEPRIHFAIVCASMGCPRLRDEAYTADRVESQLESNAIDFFARRRHFRFDPANRRIYLSSILDWFAEDFGDDQAARLKTIAGWLPTAAATRAAERNTVSITYLDYDWSLNEQPRQ